MAKKPRKQNRIGESRVAYRAGRGGSGRVASKESPLPVEDAVWVEENYGRLSTEYAGRWVAVSQHEVVGDGVRLATALRRARAKGHEHPFVTAFRLAALRGTRQVAHWL
jgi:hypothetical protein